MAQRIVECIPNISDGRRSDVIEQVVEAAKKCGIQMLDVSSDPDHNRSVLSFAGDPESVANAAYAVIQTAATLIDLNNHQGEHPRIGATDVVPFVPISGVTIEECAQMARELGQKVASELGIPVYLYEAAAAKPERTNLENIRRGQYEGLKSEIELNPDRLPDFGPAKLGPAGATVSGARSALIAFNVYLTTGDVSIAKSIAKAVRHSSGGFRFVKAAGFLVEGQAQVSMNLTDFRQTPIHRVLETIRSEAGRYGVGVKFSELVGLIPQEALVDAAVWYTQLDMFSHDQVLETRMGSGAAKKIDGPNSAETFLDQVAANTPTPGGGSAAAYTGALAASLVAMVAGNTIGKKKYEPVLAMMQEALVESMALKGALEQGVTQDSDAFDKVMVAIRLPKETDTQAKARTAAIDRATMEAARLPLGVAQKCLLVMELAIKMMMHANVNAISDAASAVALAHAAINASGLNVRINVHGLSEPQTGTDLLMQLAGIESKARILNDAVPAILKDRAGL